MAKIKIGSFVPTALQTRTLYKVFSDPTTCAEFVAFLNVARAHIENEQVRSAKAYALTDETTAKAMALQAKGQVQVLDDFIAIVQQVNR